MRFMRVLLLVLTVVAVAAPREARGQGEESVVGSPHDLSVSGPGAVHALHEEQVCIFCHAPHNATGQRPLWNRHMPPTMYRIYESSTTDARIWQPTGPSKMCLSCHDGSLALGLLACRPATEPVVMSRRSMPPGPSNLERDLSDDHPIGFRYDRALAYRDPQIKNPDVVTKDLPLGKHGELHCTTCHDPHDNSLGAFLRETSVRSAICLSCHQLHGWDHGSHAVSRARVRGREVDPTQPLLYDTVADNACASCHRIHSAPERERLLRFRREEQNCLNCHNGSVGRGNVASDIRKRSAHRVEWYYGRHDPTEEPRLMRRHVECVDCHNPHAAGADLAVRTLGPSLGLVTRSTQFVSGIDRWGATVENARFEYEICLKCHSTVRFNAPRLRTIRQVNEPSIRLEFQPINPSFHPVMAPRLNPDVVSLIPPWRVGSVMRCTNCHNSDQAYRVSGTGATGPHGSIYEPLLIENYTTDDFTSESQQAYALCYRCHSRRSILNDESFTYHNSHVVRGQVPCSACHDAHGISRLRGNRRNHSNLINFDLSIVRPASGALGPRIEFEDRGRHSGSCTLTCHGVVHVQFQYP